MSHGSGPGSWVEFSSVSQTRILCEFGLPRHQVLLHQVWRPNLQQGRGSLLIFAAAVERPVLERIRRGRRNNTHLKNIICRVFPPDSPFSSERTERPLHVLLHSPAIHLSRPALRTRVRPDLHKGWATDLRSQHQISVKGFACRPEERTGHGRHSRREM